MSPVVLLVLPVVMLLPDPSLSPPHGGSIGACAVFLAALGSRGPHTIVAVGSGLVGTVLGAGAPRQWPPRPSAPLLRAGAHISARKPAGAVYRGHRLLAQPLPAAVCRQPTARSRWGWTKASPSRRSGLGWVDLLTMRSLRSLAQVCDTTVDEPRLRRAPCYHLETLCWWCVITVSALCSQAAISLFGVLGSALGSECLALLELQRELKLLGSAALAEEPVLDSGSWLGPPGGREGV